MIGIKLLWLGLTVIVGLSKYVSHSDIVGAIFMGVGLVLFLFDK